MSSNYSAWKTPLSIKPYNSNKKSNKQNILFGSLNKNQEAELTNIEKEIILKAKIKQTIKLKKELEKELKKIFKLKKKSKKKSNKKN